MILNNEEENNKIPVDAMHCLGRVGDQKVTIIIDSGAVSNIINNSLLKKINWKQQFDYNKRWNPNQSIY